jgi:hypothetical protein
MRTSLALSLSLSLLLLACGGDDDAGSNADASTPDGGDTGGDPDSGSPGSDAGTSADASLTPGSASIDGELDGETIEPESSLYALHPLGDGDDFVLLMPEADLECGFDFETSPPGHNAIIGFPCGAAIASTYPVSADPKAACDPKAPHVWVLVEGFEGGPNEFLAASGSVTVSSVDSTAIAGTFTADFGADGSLTGSFNSIVCPE